PTPAEPPPPTPSVSPTNLVTPSAVPEPPSEPVEAPDPSEETGSEGVNAEVPEPPSASSEEPRGRYPSGSSPRLLPDVADGVQIPSRIATRLRVLDADFAHLAARGGGGIVDGVLSIVSGGLSITLGVIVDGPSGIREYLFVFGAAGVARGILGLVLRPDPSGAATTYGHMPMETMNDVEARLRFGEQELESLADRSRLLRILDAAINIASGVAIIPIYLGPNDFTVPDVFGAIVLIGAGVSVISGVINLFTRTEAEKRWSAYEELRERLGERDRRQRRRNQRNGEPDELDAYDSAQLLRPPEMGPQLQFGLGAMPSGGAITLGGTF
ncbi:MAG: hypothetical protein AAGF12_33270, partial [Myxococcota bacterium]